MPQLATVECIATMVYFIERSDDGAIKIGLTHCLNTRFNSLASFHRGEKLRILGVMNGNYDVEQAIHRAFFDRRLEGEWFAPDDQLADFIESYARIWTDADDASESGDDRSMLPRVRAMLG